LERSRVVLACRVDAERGDLLRAISRNLSNSPYVLTLSAIQVYRALMPGEGFEMFVQHNATDCNTKKRCLHLPGGFGTGVCFCEGRILRYSRAEGRACPKMSQNVPLRQKLARRPAGSVRKCPQMSAPGKRCFAQGVRATRRGSAFLGRSQQMFQNLVHSGGFIFAFLHAEVGVLFVDHFQAAGTSVR